MAAEFFQYCAAFRQRAHDRATLNTASTSLSGAVLVEADNNRWTMIFLRDAGSDNPQDAGMPFARAQNDPRVA